MSFDAWSVVLLLSFYVLAVCVHRYSVLELELDVAKLPTVFHWSALDNGTVRVGSTLLYYIYKLRFVGSSSWLISTHMSVVFFLKNTHIQFPCSVCLEPLIGHYTTVEKWLLKFSPARVHILNPQCMCDLSGFLFILPSPIHGHGLLNFTTRS